MVNFKKMNQQSNPNPRATQVRAPPMPRVAKKIKAFCKGGGNI